jgi:hypothetical protein
MTPDLSTFDSDVAALLAGGGLMAPVAGRGLRAPSVTQRP